MCNTTAGIHLNQHHAGPWASRRREAGGDVDCPCKGHSFEEAIDTTVIECGLDEYQREDLEVLITLRLAKEPKSP